MYIEIMYSQRVYKVKSACSAREHLEVKKLTFIFINVFLLRLIKSHVYYYANFHWFYKSFFSKFSYVFFRPKQDNNPHIFTNIEKQKKK